MVFVLGPLESDSGAGPGQLLPVSGQGPPDRIYKVICSCQLPVLGLEVHGSCYAVNQGWLIIVSCWGPLSKRYGACQGQLMLVWHLWNFERF